MHQVQIMDDPDSWTLGHGLGLQLVRRGDRVFFGHGGAMPGFLAMLLGRREEKIGAALVTNASTPGRAVEEITGELAEKALELFPAETEAWRTEAEPPSEISELLGIWWTEGVPFVFLWEDGKLRARPTERATSCASSRCSCRKDRTASASPRVASAGSSSASSATLTGASRSS